MKWEFNIHAPFINQSNSKKYFMNKVNFSESTFNFLGNFMAHEFCYR